MPESNKVRGIGRTDKEDAKLVVSNRAKLRLSDTFISWLMQSVLKNVDVKIYVI